MAFVRVFLAALCLASASLCVAGERDVLSLFEAWAVKHSKVFLAAEKAHRLSVFADNLRFIEEHNAKKKSYTLALNEFAHLTHDEFKGHYLGFKGTEEKKLKSPHSFSHENVVAPDAVDWRKEGAVTEVKNQAQCGT